MTDKRAPSDRDFIRRVIRISLVLLMYFSAAALIIYMHIDGVRALSASVLASAGNYDAAVKTAEKIEKPEIGQKSLYDTALSMLEGGLYDEASGLFGELEGYSDSAEKQREALYLKADAMYMEADYDRAAELFASLGTYADAAERRRQCIYAGGMRLFEQGEYMSALSVFNSLGDYSDSRDMVYKAALAMTGDEESAQIIAESGGLSAEALEKAANIALERNRLPIGALACGNYHSLYLRPDGSVAACGDNSKGQCDVEGWEDILQICAGAEHSVALRSDGTVLAAGSNEHGQCDVSNWKNVVSIAASDYDTLALLEDGSIVSCGFHDYSSLSEAGRAKAIFAGSYAAAALSVENAFSASHGSVRPDEPQLLIELGIGPGYSAALYADGSLKMSFLPENSWQDIIHIDAASRALLALDSSGNVHAHFFRESDSIDFSGLRDIASLAAGTEHYVFLAEDGSIQAFGDNSRGQCDVERLLPAPAAPQAGNTENNPGQ